jgi:hypothetical protein
MKLPYEEYADKVMPGVMEVVGVYPEDIRSVIEDAWLAGVAYSLERLEKKDAN